MSPKGRLLTQSERILLLLHEEDFNPDEYMAPYTICQDGISESLDILKNNVSRELSKLKEDGFVHESLSRVKGFDRRRKVYFPTDEGKDAAEDLIDELMEESIKFRDGSVKTLSVQEALQELRKKHPGTTVFHVEEWMRKKDVLDYDDFSLPDYVEKERESVEMTVTAPAQTDFYGRKEEIGELVDVLKKESPPMIVISGIAGIGKSSLGVQVMEEFQGKKDILWYNFHTWDTVSGLMEVLNEFCEKGTGDVLKETKNLPGYIQNFTEIISNMEPMIFFDDGEKMPSELKGLFELLLDQKKRGEKFNVVLMTREKPDFYDVRDVMQNNVHELKLGPLNLEEIRGMFDGSQDIEDIYEKTGGHPLYLELYKKYPGESVQMREFIEKEIYSKLDDMQRDILERLSLFWNPVEKNVALDEGETDELLELKNSHLVEETREGKIGLHSILKDFLSQQIPGDKLQRMHSSIAERLERGSDERELEVLYHYEKGSDWDKALDKLEQMVYYIADLDEVTRSEIIDAFPVNQIPEDEIGRYYSALGDIYLSSKEWERAIENYEKAVESGVDSSELRDKIGEAQMNLERWRDTIRTHKDTLQRYRKEEDLMGQAKELLSLGIIHRRKDDYVTAEKYYRQAERLIEEHQLDEVRGALFNNLGFLYLFKKQYKSAREHFQRALDEGGDPEIAHENLSKLYHEMGDTERAVEHLDRSINQAERRNKVGKVIELLMEQAAYRTQMNQNEKALRDLNRALSMEEKRGGGFLSLKKKKMSETEANIHDRMADVHGDMNNWDSALEHRLKTVEGYEERDDHESANRQRLKYAYDLRDSGKTDKAIQVLKRAERELSELNIIQGVTACQLERARLYLDKGDLETARNIAKDVWESAENRGDQKGAESALKILIKILKKMGRKEEAERYQKQLSKSEEKFIKNE